MNTPEIHTSTATPDMMVDPYFEIEAHPGGASLLIHGACLGQGQAPTRQDVDRRLKSLHIVHGIDWQTIDRILAGGLYDRTHRIAKATPPQAGKSAFIEDVFPSDPEAKPRLLWNGKADYKNIDNIRQVKKGEALAKKHPALPGKDGTDIFGQSLPTLPVLDAELLAGPNTVFSEDGLQLLAATDGFLYHSEGKTCVGETYVVKGDVGFKTGNLHYRGNIHIQGDVADGFLVKSDGDIVVEGCVGSAALVSGGSVRVGQGVFGRGKGRIAAKGSIQIQSAQDAVLECEGTLEVEREMRNCQVAAGAVKADGPGCVILGGSVKSYSDASIAVLGAEGCRTEIHIVDRQTEAARRRLPEIERERRGALTTVSAMEFRIKDMRVLFTRFKTQVPKHMLANMQESLERHALAKDAIARLEDERQTLSAALNSCSRHTGKCKVLEQVSGQAILDLYGHMRSLRPEDAGMEWRWAPESMAGDKTRGPGDTHGQGKGRAA